MKERRFVREVVESKKRILILSFVVGAVFFLLLTRLWHLQILRSDDYREMSENNRLRFVPVAASRGAILDRSGKVLVLEYVLTDDRSGLVAKFFDLQMLVYFGRGKERTVPEYHALLERAGFVPGRVLATDSPVTIVEGNLGG